MHLLVCEKSTTAKPSTKFQIRKAGLEPTTTQFQTEYATKLRYFRVIQVNDILNLSPFVLGDFKHKGQDSNPR